jgi:hypothetical protein
MALGKVIAAPEDTPWMWTLAYRHHREIAREGTASRSRARLRWPLGSYWCFFPRWDYPGRFGCDMLAAGRFLAVGGVHVGTEARLDN